MDTIRIRGARTHNLQNIDLDIPRDQLIVVTGLSGSGKSSLAFDTLYAEGQRRYVESLSSYARQFLSMMEKPDVDHIEGLSPAIAIDQKSTSHNPRSTVGTVTEIYDYLRVLFARIGEPRCPVHRWCYRMKRACLFWHQKYKVEKVNLNLYLMNYVAKVI
jgi:excinuclease ABC subunit A